MDFAIENFAPLIKVFLPIKSFALSFSKLISEDKYDPSPTFNTEFLKLLNLI